MIVDGVYFVPDFRSKGNHRKSREPVVEDIACQRLTRGHF